jgi:adenylate cyclase
MSAAETFTIWNNVFPAAALLTAYLAVILYRVVFEQAEARATRGVMGKYLSPAVMTEVLKDPDNLELGGVKRDMTVLFSDIRGFTSVSERMDPQDLVAFLNNFLTEMTDIVYVQKGVLDKYMGDCIMAFWGAPLIQPNHAELCVRTGYDMVKRLHQLQKIWISQGLPKLNIGVGVNTGPMTVGNVGSTMRFDYTVMGDAVNLGSRVEGVNKEYGTNMIVTEFTYEAIKDTWVCRYLDLIAVKGKKEPTAIYEVFHPIGESPEPDLTRPEGFMEAWDAAMALYREQKFEEAQEAFEYVRELFFDDGPSMVYVERCEVMAQNPPGDGWDGVFVMTHK